MNEPIRPDPDALLAELQKDDSLRTEGRLKIFLGMCPGVGKTYAMLLAGQEQREEGIDVVIGFVETHGRIETTAVAAGLPRVPRKKITHRGMTLEEMDLDAILSRHPELVLVDELAHSNVAGSRHPKRWQDVFELLQAGIDVYTTLNIQHLESHRDIVRQITGAPVHETVADSVLDRADEIELIDITSEQLRKRLEEGKVYLGERAVTASENFFREGNLKALRELALRITADRADQDLRQFMHARRIHGPWRTRERLLVAIGASPFSERLIRLTRRAAAARHASWLAVHVDMGGRRDAASEARLESNLTLSRSLGAEVVLTTGTSLVEALLRVARERNITQIVVGKPIVHPLIEWFSGGSLVSKLVRRSGEIDIYVVRADKSAVFRRPAFGIHGPQIWRELGLGALIVSATTLLGLVLNPAVGYSTVGLLYLLSVLISATFLSQMPSLVTAALSALMWNFLFIPPLFTFYIHRAHDFILFGMYFVVALVTGHLHSRLHERERAERKREQQAIALYRFSRKLVSSPHFNEMLKAAVEHLHETFVADFAILLKGEDGKLSFPPIAGVTINEHEFAVANWTFMHGETAGRFTNTLPQSMGFYLPIRTPSGISGVLATLVPRNATMHFGERQMLETFCTQLALAIERFRLQEKAAQSQVEEKSRQLQKTLLDSVSHELRTPLAIISASAQRLATSIPDKEGLLVEIATATKRLERVVTNLLDLTRVESGSVRPRQEWCDLREIVEQVIAQIRAEVPHQAFHINISPDAAMILADAALLEEILRNLIRNATQHTTSDEVIEVGSTHADEKLHVIISDHGSGISEEMRPLIFGKFFRGPNARPGGLGLGLALARGFAETMGGSLEVRSRHDGQSGTEFILSLPSIRPTTT